MKCCGRYDAHTDFTKWWKMLDKILFWSWTQFSSFPNWILRIEKTKCTPKNTFTRYWENVYYSKLYYNDNCSEFRRYSKKSCWTLKKCVFLQCNNSLHKNWTCLQQVLDLVFLVDFKISFTVCLCEWRFGTWTTATCFIWFHTI